MNPKTEFCSLPDIDIAEGLRHCNLLDPATSSHIFAAFPEAPGAMHPPIQVSGQLRDVADTLMAAQKGGCGIFITANCMRSNQRRKSEIARIRAVHRDVDQTPVPTLPLAPSLEISTSPDRWQDYIFSDPDDPLTSEEAERINRVLANAYHGDPRACDIARLLRLAGSWHLKAKPFRVRIIGGHGRRYSRAALREAFPAAPPRSCERNNQVRLDAHPDRYLAAAMQNLLSDLAVAQEGQRNSTLNWSAFRLGQLQVPFDEVSSLLTPIAIEIGLGHQEISTTIRSGWTAGVAKAVGGNS